MSNAIAVVSKEEYDSLSFEQKANAMTHEQRAADIASADKEEAKAREREKHCPYKKWAQVNLDPEVCKARRQLIRDCPSAMVILEFLMEQVNGKNAIICSQTVLSEALGYDTCTISRSLKVLRERNFIETVKSGKGTIYRFNKRLIWKSWGTNYRYGKFDAVVLISESEQDEDTLREKPVAMSRIPTIEVRKPRKKDSQPRKKGSQQTEEEEWEDSPTYESEECPDE